MIYEEVGFFPTEWEKTQVLICTNLALMVFMAVVLAIGREPIRFRRDRADEETRRLLLRRFWFIAAPLALLGLSATLYRWEARAQGLSLSQFDTRTGEMALTQVNGYYISAVGLLTTLAAMIVYLGRLRTIVTNKAEISIECTVCCCPWFRYSQSPARMVIV